LKRIAALVPDVLGVGMGQGLRIEFWARHLEAAGWTVDFYPFEDAALHEVIHEAGHSITKASRLLACYARRLRLVLGEIPCDVLFVYREAAALGPALLERLAFKGSVPVVYDLDDPIFVPYRGPANGWFSLLKFPGKTRSILRRADHVITINQLMGDYAAQYNQSVTVVPMFLDTAHYLPRSEPPGDPVRVGWIGSSSTMPNLHTIAGPLARLQAQTGARLRVIGKGSLDLPGVDTEILQWSAAREVADLAACHIGVVPLTDLPWNRWKFNFKTIQYMAVGLPVVARRMGSNVEIITDGVNGFLVESQQEWTDRLLALATDPELRQRMGRAARATAVERYSNDVQLPRIVSLLDGMVPAVPSRRVDGAKNGTAIGNPRLEGGCYDGAT